MSRDDDGEGKRASRRALRILERLSGSGASPDESIGSLENTRVADRLHQIEQLFLLHGGERDTGGPAPDTILFEWGHLQALERIGEGSSGEVFRAYDRVLDREVALKLLKTDQARPFQSQLFLHEARQLAMVRHRNVLAVHGAAVHEGRPGLWTDLITGGTADDPKHAATLKDPEAVLDLVESLALAVDAVHSVGLVHGDIKPSNIMRDAAGDWVLMDFGASQDQRGGPDGPSITSGTPLYMAPEVVLGDAPDIASDRYALGATLYRVLTGRVPIQAGTWSELVEKHRAGQRPASAEGAGVPDAKVARLIDRLMAPDPDQRPTLQDVLAEIRAIREAPQRRFRRLALGSIAAVLVLGLTLTSIGFYRANEARLLAEQEQRNTHAVNEFLQQVLHAPSSTGRGRDLTVEEMLDEAAARVERALPDQPEARVIVHRVLAASYNSMHLTEQAEEQVRIGRAALEALGLEMPSVERKLALEYALTASIAGDREEAIDRAGRFLEAYADALDEDHIDLRYARTYQIENLLPLGRLDEAAALMEVHFDRVPEPETATDPFGYIILRNRTNLYREQGRLDEALEAAEQAVDWLDRYPRTARNDRNDALTNLAIGLAQANDVRRAIDVFAELVPLQERIYGPGTNEHVSALSNLAFAQYEAGRGADALATVQIALSAIDAEPGRVAEPNRLIVMTNLANALKATGDPDRAEAVLRETHGEVLALMGPRHPLTLTLEYNLAELLSEQGQFEEARTLAEGTLDTKAAAFGDDHYMTLLTKDNLAVALAGLGRGEDALRLHDEALAPLNEQFGPDHPHTLLVERHRLATLQRFRPEQVEADAIERLVQRHEQAFGVEHPKTEQARALRNL